MKASTVTSVTERVNDALDIPIERIIPDLKPLVATILLYGPDEYERINREYPFYHFIYNALDEVRAIATDKATMYKLIDDGFFIEQVEYILRRAKRNQIAGTRLTPALFTALHEAKYLKIPTYLKRNIEAQIEHQNKIDGFVIRKLTADKTIVRVNANLIPV